MKRDMMIRMTAVLATTIMILSFALYVTEYWIVGVVFSMFAILWLGSYIGVNYFDIKEEQPPEEQDDHSTISNVDYKHDNEVAA